MLGSVIRGKLRDSRSRFVAIGLCLSLGVSLGTPLSHAHVFKVTPSELSQAIAENRTRVNEFRWLANWGKTRGVSVFAAGGTAAGLAHYVKQFLEQKDAEAHSRALPFYQSRFGRFGWNYFDVYRSTQDADIVIDGTEADAVALETALATQFPYLQGGKSVWEVRLLRYPRGTRGDFRYKDPLIGDPEFHNQHSDSHSTGLIELTESKSAAVRDLAEWDNETDPRFLMDVVSGELTFYERETHKQTRRYLDGNNPEILSALRALTKAFQYGGRISPQTRQKLKRIIDEYDPSLELTPYAQHQVTRNALKLFWHSQDVERSWNELEQLGLRQKLVRLGGDVGVWLDRIPVPTLPLGTTGDTAATLNIDEVAHESKTYLSFENILMSRRGLPNVFQSREGKVNEAAIHGDGFYTKRGKFGARSTGFTIRFRVKPNARLGHDFIIHDDFVIMRNRAAFDVIEQSLERTQVDYLRMLVAPNTLRTDKGLIEQIERRLIASAHRPDAVELSAIRQIFADYFFETKMAVVPPVLEHWLKQGMAKTYPEINHEILEALMPGHVDMGLSLFWLYGDKFKLDHPWAWFARFLENPRTDTDDLYRAIAPFLMGPDVVNHLPFVERLLSSRLPSRELAVLHGLFRNPAVTQSREASERLVTALMLNSEREGAHVLLSALSLPLVLEDPVARERYWKLVWKKKNPQNKEKEILVIKENSEASHVFITKIYPQGHLNEKLDEAMKYAVHSGCLNAWSTEFAGQLETKEDLDQLYRWIAHVDGLKLSTREPSFDFYLNGIASGLQERLRSKGSVASAAIDNDAWTRLFFDLQDRGGLENASLMAILLSHQAVLQHPEWITGYLMHIKSQGKEEMLNGQQTRLLAQYAFTVPGLEAHSEVVDSFLKNAHPDSKIELVKQLLSSSRWQPVWDRVEQAIKPFIGKAANQRERVNHALLSALKANHDPVVLPELRRRLVEWMPFDTLMKSLEFFDFEKLSATDLKLVLAKHFTAKDEFLSDMSKVSLLMRTIREANPKYSIDALWGAHPEFSEVLLEHLPNQTFGTHLFDAWIKDATTGRSDQALTSSWNLLFGISPTTGLTWGKKAALLAEKTTSSFRNAHPELLAKLEAEFLKSLEDPKDLMTDWTWEQIRDFQLILVSAYQTPAELQILEQKLDRWIRFNHQAGSILVVATLRAGLFQHRADWILRVASDLEWLYGSSRALRPFYDPRSNLSNLLNTLNDQGWDKELRRILRTKPGEHLTPELIEKRVASPSFWMGYQAKRLRDLCNDLLRGKAS